MLDEAAIRRRARELGVRTDYAEKDSVNSWVLYGIYRRNRPSASGLDPEAVHTYPGLYLVLAGVLFARRWQSVQRLLRRTTRTFEGHSGSSASKDTPSQRTDSVFGGWLRLPAKPNGGRGRQ